MDAKLGTGLLLTALVSFGPIVVASSTGGAGSSAIKTVAIPTQSPTVTILNRSKNKYKSPRGRIKMRASGSNENKGILDSASATKKSIVGGSSFTGTSGYSVIQTFPVAPLYFSGTKYAAPNGTGSSCSFSTPCSAATAMANASAGDVVLFRGGFYYFNAPPLAPNGGSSSQPITYAAYPYETPVITGAQPLTGWSHSCSALTSLPTGTNCWSATIPTGSVDFDYLLYVPSGVPPSYIANAISRRSEAFSVQGGYLYNTGTSGCGTMCVHVNDTDISQMCSGGVCTPHDALDIKFYNFNNWNVDVLRLSSISHGVPSSELVFNNSPTFTFNTGGRYLIQNSREYFESNATPGTFYIDCSPTSGSVACASYSGFPTLPSGSVIYYLPESGEDPSKDSILAPQLSQILVANGASQSAYGYMTFEGLTFVGDNYVLPSTSLPSTQSEPNISAALSFIDTKNVVFDSSVIAHTSGWGLEFTNDPYGNFPSSCSSGCTVTESSTANYLTNSLLFDIGASAIRLGRFPPSNLDDTGNTNALATSNTTITNNLFTSTGRMYASGEDGCILITSSHDNTIENNECSDSYGGGIALGAGPDFQVTYVHDNTIELNKFSFLGQGVISDFGCVYFATGACSIAEAIDGTFSSCTNTFSNNICHDITHATQDATVSNGGTGIYIDHNSQFVTASNNLVFRTTGALAFGNHGCITSSHPPNPNNPNCVGNTPTYLDPDSKFSSANVFSNNILAYSLQGPIKRGGGQPTANVGDSFRTFTFENNIVYFDQAGPQWLSGGTGYWTCGPTVGGGFGTPCTTFFRFETNDYWSPSLSTISFITTDLSENPLTPPWAFGTASGDWQSCPDAGEDGTCLGASHNSIFQDPLFLGPGPGYPFDNYGVSNSSPAITIGFSKTAFHSTYGAGRTNPKLSAQPTAPGFPTQLISPSAF
jgi:hypothetical protein